MTDLSDLYQELILQHNRSPKNFRKLEEADARAEGYNPLCGDRLTVWVRFDDDDRVAEATFQGNGCAISRASASLMTAALVGRPRAEAVALADQFHRLVTGQPMDAAEQKALGKLAALGGVSRYPVRVKCATLPWHTLKAALAGEEKTTTE